MDLWFSTDNNNRLTKLKAGLFDVFADHNRTPEVVDYVGMVGIKVSFDD